MKGNTRGNKVLDKIYTNLSQYYGEPNLLPPLGRSDHNVITCYPNVQATYNPPSTKTMYCRSNDFTGKVFLVDELKRFDWSMLYDMNTCGEKYDMFMTVIKDTLDTYLPFKEVKVSTSDKPWVNNEYKSLIVKRQIAWKNKNKPLYNIYRNKVNRATKVIRKKYYKNQVSDLRDINASQWWRKTKSMVGLGKNSNSLNHLCNTVSNGDGREFVNTVNEFLVSVSEHIPPLDTDLLPPSENPVPDMYIIAQETVENVLSCIKLSKSPGPDDLPNWLLRDLAPILSGPVASIFNSSISEGYLPKLWRSANITVIPKTNVPAAIETDLRPISLTPTLSKILESFIAKWLWDNIKDKLQQNQYGGIPGLSTVDALIGMVHQWQQAMHEHKSSRILLLDFRKAFDLVDHNILISKLKALDVPGILIRWIGAFLTQRKVRVKLQNDISEWLSLNASVPQGSTLAPILFVVMINDLQVSTDSDMYKYMDDATVSEIISANQPGNMSQNAQQIVEWTDNNNMSVNLVKTKEMLISAAKEVPVTDPIIMNGCTIEQVKNHKLLGLNICSNLKWDDHINDVYKKANKRLHYLILLRRAGLEEKDLQLYYKQVIRPVMEYGCQVWHNNLPQYLSDKLQSIQNRAIKIIYRNNSSNNILPLADRRSNLCKSYFAKLKKKDHILNAILPSPHDHGYNTRFKTQYPKPVCKTQRFKNSFINYSLLNYQL